MDEEARKVQQAVRMSIDDGTCIRPREGYRDIGGVNLDWVGDDQSVLTLTLKSGRRFRISILPCDEPTDTP